MITVTFETDRWGDRINYPAHDEEPMEALASLFEGDLWWAADVVDRSPTRLVVRTSLLSHCADITTFEGSEEEMRAIVSIASYCFADTEQRGKALRTATEMLEGALGFPDGDASFATREERAMIAETRMRAACLTMAGVDDADEFERGLRLGVPDLIVALRLARVGECSLDEALT